MVACCPGLDFRLLSRAAVQSFVEEIRGGICIIWTVCLASCPVLFCGKRDGGISKGLEVGPHYPTPYFPDASDSVSCHVFKVLLNLKYLIAMALFLTTEPVTGTSHLTGTYLKSNDLLASKSASVR